jgi:2-iminobutanoate/2-iminopropanoate deaminase
MTMRAIETPDAPAAIGPYSQGFVANGFVFTAGQVGFDPKTGQLVEGVAAQTERTLHNLAAILKAGGADWSNVVRTTVYLQSMSDYAVVNEVYARVLGTARPGRVTVAVAGLPRGALVEIDAVAALPRG